MVSPDHTQKNDNAAPSSQRNELQGVTGTLTSRSIRSFVIRNGRMTEAQQNAIDTLLPEYGIKFENRIVDLNECFGRTADTWFEIGFGNGDALLHMAQMHPEVNIIGCEVHAPGVGHALIGIQSRGLTNVRIIQYDAMEVLQNMIGEHALARVLLFFPDPWHKKRHHKRRILQEEFVKTVSSRLRSGGFLHCATDVSDYAEWMLDYLQPAEHLINESINQRFVEQPSWRINTRFERRGQKLGHDVFDLLYKRK